MRSSTQIGEFRPFTSSSVTVQDTMKIDEIPSDLPQASSLARRDWIAGLEHGLAILDCFDEHHARLTAAQAGELVGMTRTAARRYLLTLQHLGYVAGDGKMYWLTPRVLRLGQRYIESSRLARIVQPYLQRVTSSTQEIAYVGVLDGDQVVYIARNGPNRTMNTGFVLGARVPAHVTAAGMLLLAELPTAQRKDWLARFEAKAYTAHTVRSSERMELEFVRIQAQGYALSEQQLELHYRGVAVALRNANGAVVAAMNVTMPMGTDRSFEPADDAIARVLPVLRETAAAMRNLV